jgi:hypothetical protein
MSMRPGIFLRAAENNPGTVKPWHGTGNEIPNRAMTTDQAMGTTATLNSRCDGPMDMARQEVMTGHVPGVGPEWLVVCR